LHVSVRQLFGEWLDELLHFDSKLVHTVGPLLFRPGVLTLEYIRGRRTRYVTPFRLWLATSVAYFVLVALLPTRVATAQVQIEHGKPAAARAPITLSFTDDAAPDAKGSSPQATPEKVEGKKPTEAAKTAEPSGWLARSFNAHFERFKAEDPKNFSRRLQATSASYGPHLMLLLVPLFALLLKLFYWRTPLGEHFVFSFHLSAFHGVVGMAVMGLECWSALRSLVPVLPALVMLTLLLYLPLAIWRVHRQRILRTLLKGTTLFVAYSLCWALLQVGFVFLTIMRT